jgi:hypothetical protein
MENIAKAIISFSPTIPAAVIPFIFVLRSGSLGRGILLSWLLLVLGYALLSCGVPAIGGVAAAKWVPESTGMLPIIFLGWLFALVVVAIAGVTRATVQRLHKSRSSEGRKVA